MVRAGSILGCNFIFRPQTIDHRPQTFLSPNDCIPCLAKPKSSQQASSGTEVRSLRKGVRSRGKASAQAAKQNPEIITDGGLKGYPARAGKADTVVYVEGSSPEGATGEPMGHHRDPRPGHVHRGAAHELGRTYCLLGLKQPEDLGYRQIKSPGGDRVAPARRRATGNGGTQKKAATRYREGSESEPTRDGQR